MSVGLAAGTEKVSPFGFDFYKSPVHDARYRISLGNSLNIEKRKNFADLEAKRLHFIPGPKYVKQPDWRDNIPGRTGKFLVKQRKTMTDEVMEYEKKLPAPSKYDNKEKMKKSQKICGNYLFKGDRVHYIDHKKWLATKVPPAKYNNQNVKLVKPKIFSTHITKVDKKAVSTWQIPKMSDPGPGSYETTEAIVK